MGKSLPATELMMTEKGMHTSNLDLMPAEADSEASLQFGP